MAVRFPDICPKDGGHYDTVQALAEHILKEHMRPLCSQCRTEWSAKNIDSWVHTCQMHGVPELEYFIRCEKCGVEWTIIAHSYDEKGKINHFVVPREE